MKKSELTQAIREVIRASKVQKEEQDHEVSMAINQLQDIIKNAGELMYKIGPEEKDVPGWIQDHISQAQNFINQANTNYHELEGQPDPQQLALEAKKKGADRKACWDGYRYGGTKDGKDICIKIK